MVRIWNLTSGKLIVPLNHPQSVAHIELAPDGRELITGSDDGVLRAWDWRTAKLKDGWPPFPVPIVDFRVTADRRAVVTLGVRELQVSDWQTKTPVSPVWESRRDFNLAMEIPAAERRVIVGGFSGVLTGYDLEAMLTPATASVEDLLRLAELVSGRRIPSQGNVVPLSSSEWAERWRELRQQNPAFLAELLQSSSRPQP